jgi:acyl carrier protein
MTVSTREEIKGLVIGTLSDIAPEADFSTIATGKPLREQIDIDSFDFLNVIIRLSERLKMDIPEADYSQLATLDSIVDYLAKKASGGT